MHSATKWTGRRQVFTSANDQKRTWESVRRIHAKLWTASDVLAFAKCRKFAAMISLGQIVEYSALFTGGDGQGRRRRRAE